VYLDDHSNAVQPDLIFVLEKNSDIVKELGIVGVPDLIIETSLPVNPGHYKVKKNLYEKFGVQEYWIINLQTKEALGYTLKAGVYAEIGTSIGKIHSLLLQPEFEF
jgi:Uma2 family endonuclease